MARLNDWKTLATDTFRSLDSRRLAALYSVEWPETRKRLMAEQEEEIAGERGRIRRLLRTASALMYGVTKRLAPQRRVLFVLAIIVGAGGLLGLLSHNDDIRASLQVIVSLTASFAILTFLLAAELIDKIKFRDELQLARELQAGLVPKNLPEVPGFQLSAYNEIANMVGGDIYDFVPMPDGRVAILFGDASGHGMAAGLVMAVTHAAFRTQLDIDAEPDAMFATLNRILCRTGTTRSYFAGVYLLLSPAGEYRVMVAGHPPLLQFDAGGVLKRTIGTGAYPLGIKPHFSWGIEHGTLSEGDSLILHSDGLAEARNDDGESFGYDRVGFVAARLPGRPAYEVLYGILAEYRMYVGDSAPEDDVSLAVIRKA